MLPIVRVTGEPQLSEVRTLFEEYAASVGDVTCFAEFADELAGLPSRYGILLLAPGAGCVAVRSLPGDAAELKRLYVREAARGAGLGRRLVVAAIEAARARGCSRIVLDTLPRMREAMALYRSLGFAETTPYLAQPTPGALCFELRP